MLDDRHHGEGVERLQQPQEHRVPGGPHQVGARVAAGDHVGVGVGEPQRGPVAQHRDDPQRRAQRQDHQEPAVPPRREPHRAADPCSPRRLAPPADPAPPPHDRSPVRASAAPVGRSPRAPAASSVDARARRSAHRAVRLPGSDTGLVLHRHRGPGLDTLAITDGIDPVATQRAGRRRAGCSPCSSALPAAAVAGWLLAGLPLLLLGVYRPLPALLLGAGRRRAALLAVARHRAPPPQAPTRALPGRCPGHWPAGRRGGRRRGRVRRVQRRHAQRAARRQARPRHLRAVRHLAGRARLAADPVAGGGVRRPRPGADLRQRRVLRRRRGRWCRSSCRAPPMLFAVGRLARRRCS